jgi:hypothetical protein
MPICEMFKDLVSQNGFKQQECLSQALYDFVYKYFTESEINEYLDKINSTNTNKHEDLDTNKTDKIEKE